MTNIDASEQMLRLLADLGVADILVCAGARNSPLVSVLERATGVRAHSFFEERSAAFFALGRSRRDRRPVAVMTTSGTAAAELLPAVIEAFHTGVPLILVTADRPRRLRGTGAPQAIDQTGLFGKFVESEFDFEAGERIHADGWKAQSPLHLNICFDEPLLDRDVRALALKPKSVKPKAQVGDLNERVRRFLSGVQNPVAVVGTISSAHDRVAVENFLVSTGMPVYLESTSGLRESAKLASQALRAGDRVLSWALKHELIDSVLRIGGVPTVRIWRDLDDPRSEIDVFSMGPWPFAGLSRGEFAQGDLATLLPLKFQFTPPGALRERDLEGRRLLEALYESEPLAEPSMVRGLEGLMSDSALVYVGNSLPIREWDLSAPYGRPRAVEANRGVNGIDGQLSTFLGLQKEDEEGWALVGDLTALYDLTAPWAFREENGTRARLVVLNNGGGKIFSRIFKSALFENPHALDFAGWAQMWNLPYEAWTTMPQTWSGRDRVVIELKPDNEATARFWNAHDGFWEKT